MSRLRYLGIILYDAGRAARIAAQKNERNFFPTQKEILLGLHGPEVVAQVHMNDVSHSWITAAQESPVWNLISTYGVTFPLHPESRTLPMVWYVPPLSPVIDAVTASDNGGKDHRVLLSAILQVRIPMEYLTGLFTADDTTPIGLSLRRLAAIRSYMRDMFMDHESNESIAAPVGMDGMTIRKTYRLLVTTRYDKRYVISAANPELPRGISGLRGCPAPYNVEVFHGIGPSMDPTRSDRR